MSPPISKDWWIAAALTSATLPAAVAQTAATTAPRVGVVSAATSGAAASSAGKTVVVGNDIAPGQRLATGPNGQLHVLLLDQSALTLGPDTELVIEAFAFDPAAKQGQIRLGLTKGVLRVVGGHISKTQATVVATPQGKVEILGGISIVQTGGNSTFATFLFGQSMQVTSSTGNVQTVTRPGFGVSSSGGGMSSPQRVPPAAMSAQLQQFEIRSTSSAAVQSNVPPGTILNTPQRDTAAAIPGIILAPDRLSTGNQQLAGSIPSQTLRDLLSVQSPNQS